MHRKIRMLAAYNAQSMNKVIVDILTTAVTKYEDGVIKMGAKIKKSADEYTSIAEQMSEFNDGGLDAKNVSEDDSKTAA